MHAKLEYVRGIMQVQRAAETVAAKLAREDGVAKGVAAFHRSAAKLALHALQGFHGPAATAFELPNMLVCSTASVMLLLVGQAGEHLPWAACMTHQCLLSEQFAERALKGGRASICRRARNILALGCACHRQQFFL